MTRSAVERELTTDGQRLPRYNPYPMKRRLHPLYTRLLLLAIVIGPFAWLVFTEDGQWRTDTVLLSLMGKTQLNLALDRLYPGLSEERIGEQFPDLELRCTAVDTSFGDRVCTGEIGTFNGIPSDSLVLYYAGERLAAAKIAYRRSYHGRMLRWLHDRLGTTQASLVGRDDKPSPTHAWAAEAGLVVARAGELGRDDEPAVLWLSQAAVPDRMRD